MMICFGMSSHGRHARDSVVYIISLTPAPGIKTISNNTSLHVDDNPGSTDPNDIVAVEMNGSDAAKRIGTSLMLKVMAGDRFEVDVAKKAGKAGS